MQTALHFSAEDDNYNRPRNLSRPIPSLIKWTGSKRGLARKIVPLIPPYRRYIEPFVGGGAILFATGHSGAIAGDIYQPLIELWRLIQCAPDTVVKNYRAQWMQVTRELDALDLANLPPNETLPAYFYQVRDRFNCHKDPLDLNFIMRTCVNGIVRFNKKGDFNNSFHLSRRGMRPDNFHSIIQAWRSAIKGVEFVCQDYEATLDMAQPGDFVYLDPPYARNKQRYINDLDIDRFFAALDRLNKRNVKWALSFDGRRGNRDLTHDIPLSLYKRHMFLAGGNSAVNKVLNGPVEKVEESLYINY
jgi:DNA adenine methylase